MIFQVKDRSVEPKSQFLFFRNEPKGRLLPLYSIYCLDTQQMIFLREVLKTLDQLQRREQNCRKRFKRGPQKQI